MFIPSVQSWVLSMLVPLLSLVTSRMVVLYIALSLFFAYTPFA